MQQGAVVFICDSTDEKDLGRSRLFNSWNRKLNKGEFHFQPAIIEYEDGTLHVGIIIDIKNPNAQLFLKEFENAIREMRDKQL